MMTIGEKNCLLLSYSDDIFYACKMAGVKYMSTGITDEKLIVTYISKSEKLMNISCNLSDVQIMFNGNWFAEYLISRIKERN